MYNLFVYFNCDFKLKNSVLLLYFRNRMDLQRIKWIFNEEAYSYNSAKLYNTKCKQVNLPLCFTDLI